MDYPWLSLVRLANRRTKNLRTLRWIGILIYSFIVQANIFLPPPRVLLNGPPKAGTHLLSDCLSLMPKMMFSGKHFALTQFVARPNTPHDAGLYGKDEPNTVLDDRRLKRFLNACRNGMFVTAHARFHPVFQAIIEQLGFRHILLVRDPRDVAVSDTLFVTRERWHPHHRYFAQVLKDNHARLMAYILGFSGEQAGRDGSHLAPLGERLRGFIDENWLEGSSVLVCRFEDIVGPQGGGDHDKQISEIQRIAQYVERTVSYEEASTIARGMYSTRGLTFRKGSTGDWRNHFSEAHKDAFKASANDILVRLGYEVDDGW